MSLEGVTPANTNPMPTPPAGAAPAATPAPEPQVPAVEPTPVPPAPEEVKLPEPPVEEKPSEQVSDDLPFEPTGNEYIDEALTALHEGGVDFTRAFGKFAETGNEEDIDLAHIEEKIGKAAARGILAGVKAENQKLEQEAAATAQKVHEAAGSKEMWDGVCEWIASGKSGLTKEGWQQYNDMLASGGVQAELAARELSRMFQQSPGFVQPVPLVQGDAPAQAKGLEPITRRAYAEELGKVIREKGENSPEAQLLHKRREYAMQHGL